MFSLLLVLYFQWPALSHDIVLKQIFSFLIKDVAWLMLKNFPMLFSCAHMRLMLFVCVHMPHHYQGQCMHCVGWQFVHVYTHTHTGKHALIKCVLDAYACIVGVHACLYVHVHTPTGIIMSSLVVCYCREVCWCVYGSVSSDVCSCWHHKVV